jgi:6-phosphogluconolactonase
MGLHRHVYADAAAAAEACAHYIGARIEEALSGEGIATLAISGGSSPKPMFRALARSGLDWRMVHLFWVDERCVPPGDPQSNYGMALVDLIEPARIPSRNVHRVNGELRPEEAAEAYVADLVAVFGDEGTPRFDVVHLGMGADGHTASLFPGEPLIEDRTVIAAAVFVEKLNQWRVTLLPAVLLAARHSAILTTGADKAAAIESVFERPYDPARLPVQLVAHHGRAVTWFLDKDAASGFESAH